MNPRDFGPGVHGEAFLLLPFVAALVLLLALLAGVGLHLLRSGRLELRGRGAGPRRRRRPSGCWPSVSRGVRSRARSSWSAPACSTGRPASTRRRRGPGRRGCAADAPPATRAGARPGNAAPVSPQGPDERFPASLRLHFQGDRAHRVPADPRAMAASRARCCSPPARSRTGRPGVPDSIPTAPSSSSRMTSACPAWRWVSATTPPPPGHPGRRASRTSKALSSTKRPSTASGASRRRTSSSNAASRSPKRWAAAKDVECR